MARVVRYRLRIYGDVQAVGYRRHAQMQAEKLGLTGLARNHIDGTVWIEVEGKQAVVEKFRHWCEKGSPHAHVERVTAQAIEPQHLADFTIY